VCGQKSLLLPPTGSAVQDGSDGEELPGNGGKAMAFQNTCKTLLQLPFLNRLKNPAAVALGRLGRGIPKNITQAERKRRAERASYARRFRWAGKGVDYVRKKADK